MQSERISAAREPAERSLSLKRYNRMRLGFADDDDDDFPHSKRRGRGKLERARGLFIRRLGQYSRNYHIKGSPQERASERGRKRERERDSSDCAGGRARAGGSMEMEKEMDEGRRGEKRESGDTNYTTRALIDCSMLI